MIKNFLGGLGSLILSVNAFAFSPEPGAGQLTPDFSLKNTGKSFYGQPGQFFINPDIRTHRVANRHNGFVSPSTRATSFDNYITHPEGTMKYYSKDFTGWDSYYEELSVTDELTIFVFGDNNEVYIQDLYTAWYSHTFVKGTLSGNTLTVPVPQAFDFDTMVGLDLELVALQETTPGDYKISDLKEITYKVDPATGVITMNLPEGYVLGVAYSDGMIDSWEYTQSFTPVTGVDFNTIPEGLEVTQLIFNNGFFGYPVYVAHDNDYLYIQGMSELSPMAVIKAKINGNKATIAQGQIAGEYLGMWYYTSCIDENDKYMPVTTLYNLEINLDHNLVEATDEDYFLALTIAPDKTDGIYEAFYPFFIYPQDTFTGTPENPYYLFVDSSQFFETGFNWFGFILPALNTEYDVIDPNYLYYRIYVDGQLQTFTPDPVNNRYLGLSGPTTELPYNINNQYDLFDASPIRLVGLYLNKFSTLGVQSVYKYQGVTTESDIVTLNVLTGEEETGIESIIDSSEGKTEYFDLNGRKISEPGNGIYILRQGTITQKIMKK